MNETPTPAPNDENHPDEGRTKHASEFVADAMGFINGLRKLQADIRAFIPTHQPQVISCDRHPEIRRPIDYTATWQATRAADNVITAGYLPCPKCAAEIEFQRQRERLHRQGVPSILLDCHFGNWNPNDPAEEANLAIAKKFAEQPKRMGFLLLLGNVGTGKGHLAVSIMRTFESAVFVKHSTLLRRLRQGYHDHTLPDPIAACQETGLLVLDEVGLSAGGRDELPMLQEILDYRYGERLPTILTSNLTFDQLAGAIGKRLVDRLKESAFEVLLFDGQSRRGEMKAQYFEGQGT